MNKELLATSIGPHVYTVTVGEGLMGNFLMYGFVSSDYAKDGIQVGAIKPSNFYYPLDYGDYHEIRILARIAVRDQSVLDIDFRGTPVPFWNITRLDTNQVFYIAGYGISSPIDDITFFTEDDVGKDVPLLFEKTIEQ